MLKCFEIYSKVRNILFSTRAGALYMILFAIAIGAATFIENDFGTSSAQEVVFRALWFELLLLFFGLSILNNIFVFRLVQNKKWPSFMFHSAILIILLGAGVTRYFGYEGMMHIRENSSNNKFLSSDAYLNFTFTTPKKKYKVSEPVFFSSLGRNHFEETFQIGKELIHVNLEEFIPNPVTQMLEDENGLPAVQLVVGGANGREEYSLIYGDVKTIHSNVFNFSKEEIAGAIRLQIDADSLYMTLPEEYQVMVMATQEKFSAPANVKSSAKTRALYSNGKHNFVISKFLPKSILQTVSLDQKIKSESMVGLRVNIRSNAKKESVLITGRKGEIGEAEVFEDQNIKVEISYGSKYIKLPFQLALRDFILERYPGTDNPSSYASEVTLLDAKNNVNENFRIFMNNILTYRGYRFFQSSYDPDEKGTYLSVNHDFWGTWISYFGYALLTIGLFSLLLGKRTRLDEINRKLSQLQSKAIIILLIFSSPLLGQHESAIRPTIAKELSSLIVQDHKGRFKPFKTQAEEVLRKISKKISLNGHSAEQIYMSMMMDPEKWEKVPVLHIGSHPKMITFLETDKHLVSYRDMFDAQSQYKLREEIRTAQQMNPKDQGVWEKAVIKLDEKVNIANMIFSGRLFRIFPIPDDKNNTWASIPDLENVNDDLSFYRKDFVNKFFDALQNASESGKDAESVKYLNELKSHQRKLCNDILPSETKINTEIKLNELSPFSWLRNFYALLGVVSLVLFLFHVISQKLHRDKLTVGIFWIICVLFVFHTVALIMRWYVSGHAPWSNGYESMIYIAWTTVLAGILFSRKSLGGLVATMILAATILLVAHMSWLDPEITPLVPVLKSYWLTIHVSLEAGSYGFLMLGAVISMINLLLICFLSIENKSRIERSLRELTMISEVTILGGLIMVSIGTYLGGVWANESWGRYWGWDAKETWALVTILVYAFILHMRFIPFLRGVFAFNVATLFGFATVIMTYYGVNYYLSGLHSYAAGDPVPIPSQVYITAICLVILSCIAYWRFRKFIDHKIII